MLFSIKAKIMFLCGVFLFLLFLSVSILMINLRSVVTDFEQVVNDAEHIVAKSRILGKFIADMETGQRGFIITGEDAFLEPYQQTNKEFDGLLAELRKNLSYKPEYLKMLEEIEHLRYKWLGVAGNPEIQKRRQISEAGDSLKKIHRLVMRETGRNIMRNIRTAVNNMSAELETAGKKDELFLLTKISTDVFQSQSAQRGFLLTGKEDFLELYYSGRTSFSENIRELENILKGETTSFQQLTSIKSLYEKWLAEIASPQINAKIEYEKNPQSMDDIARLVRRGKGKKIIDELRDVSGRFSNALEKEMKGKYEQSENAANLTNISSLIVCGFGVLSSLLLSVFIGRSVIQPVGVLINGTKKISEGDLQHKIKISNKDELGLLAESFNKMTCDLKDSMDNLNSANQQLKSEIEERKKTEEKLKATNRDLKDFVYIASHDLREPSRKVASFGKLLAASLGDSLNDDDKENLDFMINGADRMQEMIESLLVYSRVTTKGIKFERVDLNEVVEQLKKLELVDIFEETGGTLSIPENLPSINADYSQTRQLLQNLIGNALKYCKEDVPPEINIRAIRQDGMVRIEVEDNGIGIEQEHHDNIFVMFRRIRTEHKYKGSGIGLSICKKVVERHNGHIGINSTYGQGSTFWFTMPAAKTADVQQGQLVSQSLT